MQDSPEPPTAPELLSRWAEIVRTATLLRAQASTSKPFDENLFHREIGGEPLTSEEARALINECDEGAHWPVSSTSWTD